MKSELLYVLWLFLAGVINAITCVKIETAETRKQREITMWLHVLTIMAYALGAMYFVEK